MHCHAPVIGGIVFVVMGLSSGCAAMNDTESLGESSSDLLSNEQVYEVANVFNTGVANGFVLSFASVADYSDMNISFSQQGQFWPGGPVVAFPHGSAITFDGNPLPTFSSTGAIAPPNSGSAYTVAVNNSNWLDAILINRTPYATYFSLGSLMASAQIQAQLATGRWPASQPSWDLAISLLHDATDLANALCRPSANVWRTSFNVQEMRDLLNILPDTPNMPLWAPFGTNLNPAQYMLDTLIAIRRHLGTVISSPATLESGVPGLGCSAP
jgi:hypothetical protein